MKLFSKPMLLADEKQIFSSHLVHQTSLRNLLQEEVIWMTRTGRSWRGLAPYPYASSKVGSDFFDVTLALKEKCL